MPALIAFRALQGLGAGAIQPTAMTIIGDIYSVAERAKVQGYVASVWAISAVVGPDPGRGLRRLPRLALDLLRQRSARRGRRVALVRRFHEQVSRSRTAIDYRRRRAARPPVPRC